MKLHLFPLTLMVFALPGIMNASESADELLELARLAAQLEMQHGALDIALDEGADTALLGSIDVLEYDLGRQLSSEEQASVKKVYRNALASVLTPEVWMNATAKVYSMQLEKQDLENLIAFYNTDSGTRILAAQANLAGDLTLAAEQILNDNQQTFADAVDAELEKLFPEYGIGEVQ